MSELLKKATYLLSETDPLKLDVARSEVAFIGRSNVGKSSLLNSLCNRPGLANVSKTPGRTRMINIFAVDHLRWLVDLPGYGFAVGTMESRAGWAAMIEGYLTSRTALRGVYLLIDSRVGPTDLDHQMRQWVETNKVPYTLVVNKMDQVKPSQRLTQQKKIAERLDSDISEIKWVSAKEGTGIPPLRLEIVKLLESTSQG